MPIQFIGIFEVLQPLEFGLCYQRITSLFDKVVKCSLRTELCHKVAFVCLLNHIQTADDVGVFQTHEGVLLGHEQVTLNLVVGFFHIDDFYGYLLANTRINA
jgi:hypothetical protein